MAVSQKPGQNEGAGTARLGTLWTRVLGALFPGSGVPLTSVAILWIWDE